MFGRPPVDLSQDAGPTSCGKKVGGNCTRSPDFVSVLLVGNLRFLAPALAAPQKRDPAQPALVV